MNTLKEYLPLIIGIIMLTIGIGIIMEASKSTLYHVTCYSAGKVVFDNDVFAKGLSYYLADGTRVFVPQNECYWIMK
jgi:hypothetical protein